MIERLHRRLKAALKPKTTDAHWMDHLPIDLFGLRVAWREDPDCSPAQLVYGSSLRLPGEFVDPTSTAMAEAFLKCGGGGPKTNDQIFFAYNQGRQWRNEKF